MSKNMLLNYNVHDFLSTGQIDICISDIVYREKRQVVMFQNVYDTQAHGRQTFRQLVISTPIFNSGGNVQNILAVVRPLNMLNALYQQAASHNVVAAAAQPITDEEKDPNVVAKSLSMQRILRLARTIADVDTAVLVTGDSGTGKEVVAQYIHRVGKRRDKPFVVINCAALPASLLEAELFGYEKGAFTGASPSGKKGLFEEACGGTVFLDEINSMPLGLQGSLLRTIETKTVKRIGSNKNIHVNFRLIAASNEDLDELVKQKRFRMDLLYRLNVIPVDIPPLRQRKEDIIPLANNFLKYFCEKHNKHMVFSPATLHNILAYDWPGNVRQLKNFVERSVVISLEEIIGVDNVEAIAGSGYLHVSPHQPPSQANPPNELFAQLLTGGTTLEAYVNGCEKEYVSYVLQQYPNTYKAAEVLGTSQSSVMRKKKKYDL